MSKLNQIENALSSLGDAAFQKLADVYLHKKGYEGVNPIGSVIGSDKVRTGTPDTLITLPSGKYIFAEYTTQKGGTGNKLKADLHKCFDEKKTGISVTKIEEIVLCHTSLLTSKEEESLRAECQERGININIFGIGYISHDLYSKYPGIARDFLHVEVDTGQIVTPDEFITTYNKNKVATPLDTAFHFRETELEQALQGLKENDLVIISGKAGIGKSRFALEVCDRFVASYAEYEVRCIFLRGADLFGDLRVHFSEPGKFLIFVDDANRISRFEYFIQLLHDQREDQQIKVIATVRDYALGTVQQSARSYQNLIEPIELNPLDEEQIKQIVRDEYGIVNPRYLERIADISQGNPRLAIMSAKVAKRENTLNSISDVSSLYDEYYRSIRQDLEALGNENLLKASGIIAFFRTVDFSDEEIVAEIVHAFGMPRDVFWEAVRELHELELLDLYENEIARTSDQVLSTYLFYLAFFVKRVLSFSTLLEKFFPRLQYRLVDALNPVLNSFGSHMIIEIMRPHVDQAWKTYKSAGDETNLMRLIQVFWFLKTTDVLLYVRDCIAGMPSAIVDISSIEIKPNSNLASPSLLTTLGLFIHSSESNFQIALNLLVEYLVKRPKELPEILYLLVNTFGFEHDSYTDNFVRQRAVISVLLEQAQGERNEMFSKLFLAVAKEYLKTHFSTHGMKTRRTVNILNFDLPPTAELFQLRSIIWQGIFQFYQIPILREIVINLLHDYSTSGYKVKDIVMQDAVEVIPFLKSVLEPDSYSCFLAAQKYLNYLENHEVMFDKELRDRFTNQVSTLSRILFFDLKEMRDHQLNYEECKQLKQQQIEEHFANYDFYGYQKLFEQCLEIQREEPCRNRNIFRLSMPLATVLISLSHRDSDLYVEVMKNYISLGNPFQINDSRLVDRLINICGVETTDELLRQSSNSSRQRWLFDFYWWLPQEEITAKHLDQLYKLYRSSPSTEIPNDLSFLLKYQSIDEYIIVRAVEIILERTKDESSGFLHILSMVFNEYTDLNKKLPDLFKDHVEILKQAYLAVLKMDVHVDHNMKSFVNILDLDSTFLIEYIDWIYRQKESDNCFHDSRNYSFIWEREDYEELTVLLIKYSFEQEKDKFFFEPWIKTLFILNADDKDNVLLWMRQDNLLDNLIERHDQDIDFIQFIFSVVMQLSYERRHKLTAAFLMHNQDFEAFEKIPLEPNSWSCSGSAVPVFQRRIAYIESLLPLLNTVELLQHRQYVERYIQSYREMVEKEKRKDFMED